MNLNLRPLLSALWRNRTGALLVALQISIALAVLVNAVFVVKQRVDKLSRDPGIDVPNIVVAQSLGFTRDYDQEATRTTDLAWLRSRPGVVAVTPINELPLSGGGSGTGIYADAEGHGEQGVNYFRVDEQGLAALGVKLSAGRGFTAAEITPAGARPQLAPVILSQPVANAMFPGGNAVGGTVYSANGDPMTVIGVIQHMHGSWVSFDKLDHVMLVPALEDGKRLLYMVRTKPGLRDAVLRDMEAYLPGSNPTRLVSWVRPLEYFSQRSYLADRNMAIYLTGVTAALLAITALGVFGLATFNVSTRTRQIGTRRAVGARRRDIVRHFLVENWLVTTAGVLVGCVLALGVGYWLSVKYQLPRLDLYYLVAGVVVLWVIGLLSAWQPARRAAAVSPAVATRTV